MTPKTGRSKIVLGSLATLLALWLGLTAPTASPVTPVAPPVGGAPAAATAPQP